MKHSRATDYEMIALRLTNSAERQYEACYISRSQIQAYMHQQSPSQTGSLSQSYIRPKHDKSTLIEAKLESGGVYSKYLGSPMQYCASSNPNRL